MTGTNALESTESNAYDIIKRLQRALDDIFTAVEALEASVMHLRHENESLRYQLQVVNDQLQLANSKATSRAGRMPK